MIILITGIPGSGKTYKAVSMMQDAIKQNRNVYTNVSASNSVVPADLLSRVLDAPDDWRTTPDGSLVVYDECQSLPFYSSRYEESPIIADLARHRHTLHDLVFISQCASHIHPFIIRLAELNINLTKGSNHVF